ncbi:hypothetical protein ACLK19_19930 [Escherichia coli]
MKSLRFSKTDWQHAGSEHSSLHARPCSGRTVHCCEFQDILQNQYSALITRSGKGDHTTF